MQLLKTILKEHRSALLAMLGLTLLSGLLGIAVLAYINNRLLQAHSDLLSAALWQFGLLVLLYLIATTWSQIQLSRIGHRFIYSMQTRLVKQIMDASVVQLQTTGKAKILASLSNDIRTLSIAFTRFPELLQGALFVLVCSLYLIWLSPKIFVITAILLAIMVAVSHYVVLGHYRHFHAMRESEDALYGHYDSSLQGHKELLLNRYRAQRFYQDQFLPEAERKRHAHVRADGYHLFAVNWGNSVMLAAVGVVFYLAIYLGWATLAEATTISMTVLFMRAPLTAAIGAWPTLLQSQVAYQALEKLGLPAYQADFHDAHSLPANWQTIRLENITYAHPAQGGQVFALQPVNLTLHRGETAFLIGANGSGKSTLSMVLAGLYVPTSGKIFVDNIEITDANRNAYRQLFASVFTDFHLFDQLVDGLGQDADEALIQSWLEHLHMDQKVQRQTTQLLNTKLSQGQRKRLGLLLAAVEQRSILVLDEWAADQDPQFRRVFYEQLLPLLQTQGYTVFAISHDDKYFHHAERMLSMQHGVLTEYSATEAVAVADAHSRSSSD